MSDNEQKPTQYAQLSLGTPAKPSIELTTQVDKSVEKPCGMLADAKQKEVSIISPGGKIELSTESGENGDKPIKIIIDTTKKEVSIAIAEDASLILNTEQCEAKFGDNEMLISKSKHEWKWQGGGMAVSEGEFTLQAESVEISSKGTVSVNGSKVIIGEQVALGG